ncbi:MAG TPA: hypothetical protein VEK33_15320 [Terriglobales bacterium]|nr:hypothetical protein [Terriglobales bacterium]
MTIRCASDPVLLSAIFLFVIPCLALGQASSSPNCKLIALPPPLATFGGPATVTHGYTELGLGVGGYGELPPSPCDHGGGTDWFVRWRRGLSERIDLGFDVLADNQSDNSLGVTAKVAVRYQVNQGFRLEGGLGAADEGDGRSVNADLAATMGTRDPDRTWNYYTSLRFAGSHGCINPLCAGWLGLSAPSPPGAILPLGVIGSSARISENASFIMETGLGGVFSREHPGPGIYLHLSFGLLFNVGKHR